MRTYLTAMCAGFLFLITAFNAHAQDLKQEDDTCYSGKGQAAIAACTALLQSGSLDAVHRATDFTMRGDAYRGLGQTTRAIEDYTDALTAEPTKLPGIYVSRGYAYIDLGRYKRAIRDFNEAISLNPNDNTTADAYAGLATAYEKLGQDDKANSDLDQACTLDPEDYGQYCM